MDNQPQNTTVSNPTPEPKSASSKLALAMTVEVLAFLLIFFLFLGVLNYFNILRLDPAFPFLSFLPHLPRTGHTISGNTNFIHTPLALPTSQPFQYDSTKGSNMLKAYVDEMLLQNMRPAQNASYSGAQTTNTSVIAWTSISPVFDGLASFGYILGSNNPKSLGIILSPKDTPSNGIVTEASTAQGLKIYFQNPPAPSDLHCRSASNKVTVCEQFKESGNQKNGYGALLNTQGIQGNPKVIYFFFSCRYFNGDINYATRTSCFDGIAK